MKTLKEFNEECNRRDQELARGESWAFIILMLGAIIWMMVFLNGCSLKSSTPPTPPVPPAPKEIEYKTQWVPWYGFGLKKNDTKKTYQIELGFRDDGVLVYRIGKEDQGVKIGGK